MQNEAVEKMIVWIETHLQEDLSLLEISRQVGYSPYYCSSRFHQITGQTLKSYIAGRRLAHAAFMVRDTNRPLLDIALCYGFLSQQAFTRAFSQAYDLSPAAYRKNPFPIPLAIKKTVLFPDDTGEKGGFTMNQTLLTDAKIRVEYIPEHGYMALRDEGVQEYFPFWQRHNCDETLGMIESLSHIAHPVVGIHTAGWFWKNEKRGYTYGMGVEQSYSGSLPKGFTLKKYPGSYYLVFYHPTFDFLKNCQEVMDRVETLAWAFDPKILGFAWNEEDCQMYQRHRPETLGYEVLRPVVRV